MNVPPQGGRKHPDQKMIPVNTKNILFICGEHLETRQYGSLQALIANELEILDFSDLTHVSDEDIEQYRWHKGEEATEKAPETVESAPSTQKGNLSYSVGDTVYLDNKPFEITEVGLFDVHLRDPSQTYPIFRVEGKELLTEKYGILNSRGNRLAFSDDSAYYLLCALEILDDDGNFQGKADMFSKRTIQPHKVVTSVDTAVEALTISIGERACVDLGYMSSLSGKPTDALTTDLKGIIFHDPKLGTLEDLTGWVTADEYLSGNVRQKLKDAETAAAENPMYRSNVEALRAAQPKDLEASEIEVRLGATWIDKSYVQQFMYELPSRNLSGTG